MRLFLASDDFGDFADDLEALVGKNKKALVISNARDYLSNAERQKKIREKLSLFRRHGFSVQELDLRPYFGKDPQVLEDFVSDYDPGIIFCSGGDMFLLSTALNISGMDGIIKRRLKEDSIVYGGASAGACVTVEDIEVYERDEMCIEEVPAYYGVEAITSGLGLVQEYVIPHVDAEWFQDQAKFYRKQLAKIHADVIELNNADVYIVDGTHRELKQGNKL